MFLNVHLGLRETRCDTKPKPKFRAEPQPKPPKKGACHFCNEPGYWKRNWKLYLDDLKKKKKGSATTSSGIHIIEINLSTSDSWVLDTGSGSHIICINSHQNSYGLEKLPVCLLLRFRDVKLM